MDEITNLSYDAITRYFTHLSQFGYNSYDGVSKLVALLSLEEMLTIFSEYITEADLRSITNAIYSLSGTTCLIQFPQYINSDTLIHKTKISYLTRLTEDNFQRVTQDNSVRLEA